jgi:hypothetical protein
MKTQTLIVVAPVMPIALNGMANSTPVVTDAPTPDDTVPLPPSTPPVLLLLMVTRMP